MNSPRLSPARQASTRFSGFTYPRGMEGWVDLGGWVHTEIVHLSADHLSSNQAQCVNHFTVPPLKSAFISGRGTVMVHRILRRLINHNETYDDDDSDQWISSRNLLLLPQLSKMVIKHICYCCCCCCKRVTLNSASDYRANGLLTLTLAIPQSISPITRCIAKCDWL